MDAAAILAQFLDRPRVARVMRVLDIYGRAPGGLLANGLAFSSDEKKLYVANTRPDKFWMVYDVQADGTLANGKKFLDVTTDAADGVPDGMKIDRLGNLYATGPGGVLVISLAFHDAGDARGSDPWTEAMRWDRAIAERVEG